MKRPLKLFFVVLSAAALAIYAILTLSFGGHYEWFSYASFWTIWVVTVVPIVLSTAITAFFLGKFRSLETFNVMPLVICSATFEVVSYAVSVRLLFTVSKFLDRIGWFMWTVEAILIVIYAVVLFYLIYATSHIGAHRNEIQRKVRYIRECVAQLNVVLPEIVDEELKNAVIALRDDIQYSDPMSNGAVADVEQAIATTVTEIIERIRQGGDYNGCSVQIRKARALVAERNAQIRLSK